MTQYEHEVQEAMDRGLRVYDDLPFPPTILGRLSGCRIGLSDQLRTDAERRCILAEEVAHSEISVRDILDQDDPNNRREELKARYRSHDKLIGIDGLIECVNYGCQNRYEAAEYLGVTEEFLQAAIDGYIERYGIWIRRKNAWICLQPLGVVWD